MSIRHREMCARRRRQIQTAIKSPDGQPADQDAVSEAATSEDVGSGDEEPRRRMGLESSRRRRRAAARCAHVQHDLRIKQTHDQRLGRILFGRYRGGTGVMVNEAIAAPPISD